MKLVIHDLNQEAWSRIGKDYEPCAAVSDDGTIRPCIGCFGCWNRDPGRCVVKDGYENMGSLIHHADEVVIISRYTYGGVSGFVKNVFDRCLGYVLPQFEITGGESHHRKRYDENKPFTFIFYGHDLSQEKKAAAFRYVTAVCANFRAYVQKVVFRDSAAFVPDEGLCEGAAPGGALPSDAARTAAKEAPPCRVLLLNGSMRSKTGNSAVLASKLSGLLRTQSETAALKTCLGDMDSLLPAVEGAEALVLCLPLYVDGLPSQVIRFLEHAERRYRGDPKKVYLLANMGLYESRQLVNLFGAVRQWCGVMGFAYCGGLGVSAGELIGTMMEHVPFGGWPTQQTARGLVRLASVIDEGGTMEDVFAQPSCFPRPLYIAIANAGWNRMAKQNGLKPADLFRQL